MAHPVASVLSVNVGSPSPRSGKKTPTGIGKVPVDRIEVADPGPKRRGPDGEGFSGVAGDFVGSGRHHGGTDQAVYAVAREELDHWERELGRELPDGMFGENLTTTGIDVDASEYGDVWTVGDAVLRVSAPRVPCATFALRMGERAWVRRFAERGRAGTYLAVLAPGTIRPGDTHHGPALRVGPADPAAPGRLDGRPGCGPRGARARGPGRREPGSLHPAARPPGVTADGFRGSP